MNKRAFLLATILYSFITFAKSNDYIVDNGCYYNIIGDSEMELVKCSTSKLENLLKDKSRKEELPLEIEHEGKWYRLVSIADSVFWGMKHLTLVVPYSIKSIGKGNDVNCIEQTFRGDYVDVYGNIVVNREQNRIIWTNPSCAQLTTVELPVKMYKLPENLVSSFPKMKTLISNNGALSSMYTIVAHKDTIYMIDAGTWQWHSPSCHTIECVTSDVSWNETHIQAIESYFPNINKVDVKSESDSPYISICGALCRKDGKGVVYIPARMIAETDTLVILQQVVEHIPTEFFTYFPKLEYVDVVKSKSNKAVEVIKNNLYYNGRLVAQIPCMVKESAYNIVFQRPEFPGGMGAMMRFLRENITYPKECQAHGIEGSVVVQFVVNTNGKIADVVIIGSVHPLLDEEAKRVINSMPKWKVGIIKDKKAKIRYTLPVTFRLSK